ncbi:hypothetical protein CHRY9393_02981 [Chryseobacterium fistulae]|uniref:Uncharacterized protein n=1 Tax=Chryseobacterium fistulae TaxID=2675058 RepID=A0A6N4XY31_9FLAO|nr:hypothetical protein CHRY9393_02981 [Chryseobacterium fistulae]
MLLVQFSNESYLKITKSKAILNNTLINTVIRKSIFFLIIFELKYNREKPDFNNSILDETTILLEEYEDTILEFFRY